MTLSRAVSSSAEKAGPLSSSKPINSWDQVLGQLNRFGFWPAPLPNFCHVLAEHACKNLASARLKI